MKQVAKKLIPTLLVVIALLALTAQPAFASRLRVLVKNSSAHNRVVFKARLSSPGRVRVTLYDHGHKIRTLSSRHVAKKQSVSWNVTNSGGARLPAGRYSFKVLAHTRRGTAAKTGKVRVAETAGSTTAAAGSESQAGVKSSGDSADELTEAETLLTAAIARYPILAGTTVRFGDAKGYQALCYYCSGIIIISPTHTASLNAIIDHEIWHEIDWRDNGQIDWGENVPRG